MRKLVYHNINECDGEIYVKSEVTEYAEVNHEDFVNEKGKLQDIVAGEVLDTTIEYSVLWCSECHLLVSRDEIKIREGE